MKLSIIARIVTLLLVAVGSKADSSFTTAAFNVDGLPNSIKTDQSFTGALKFLGTIFTGTPNDARQKAHRQMSTYINQFDIVNVQEDYNYHAALYDSGNNHPYRTSTSGGVGFGSGLNTLSRFSYSKFRRVTWNQCSGTEECLGKKGFTFMRANVHGRELDLYNVHMGAKVDGDALAKRRNQNEQLLSFIRENSGGRTIIMFGDFNSRWTRNGDNLEIFRDFGFKDAWAEVLRNGDYPVKGEAIFCPFPQFTGPDCEVVDKALYLDGANINLRPVSYELKQNVLSDHLPLVVSWDFDSEWGCYNGSKKVGDVAISWGHNSGDAAWACNARNDGCEGACGAKPAISKWGCERDGKIGDVTIDWGHEAGDAAWACNAWNDKCGGVCTALSAWDCKKNSNGYLIQTIEIWWGHEEGDATYACNNWVGGCGGDCQAMRKFFY